MSKEREEKAKRFYNKAKEDTIYEYTRDMAYECYDAGLVEIKIDEETGEELIRPTAYGLRLVGENPADYGIEEDDTQPT